ncbi:unnamed protein product [Miscanthus lutarioriparius]|uniref:F-box domain-containing protein n=1 Tax=Miscanthus lutarioriparius TaxID=422564 RepID=A0A811RA09_9POAL|nr:unnamed protein product [Miscanthus lutarioriparius]
MSSPAAHRVACAPASQPVFPDEILEEIFLRLDAAEDLARASAACTTFRRVVSARRFLHRFRCLHSPPVLGVLDFDDEAFHPTALPLPHAPSRRPPTSPSPSSAPLTADWSATPAKAASSSTVASVSPPCSLTSWSATPCTAGTSSYPPSPTT